jgi:hypothetical protein
VPDTADIVSVSIVLIGQFNPAIFSPAWVEKIGLISKEAADAAEVSIIHPDIAAFAAGPYAFDIRRERFSVEVKNEPLIEALDCALVIFGEYLPHITIKQFGINYSTHFSVETASRRFALGRRLAPLAPWGDFGQAMDGLSGPLTSGMIELAMIQIYDPVGTGERRVRIEPSAKPDLLEAGVFMTINDHRALKNTDEILGAENALELLKDVFDESLDTARNIVEGVRTFTKGLPE